VVYRGILPGSLEFSRYTNEHLGECVYQENTSDKWDISWYTTRERCITISYHTIENTVANVVNVPYARRMMGRLDVIPKNIQWLSCILIGCIFYGMVQNLLFIWNVIIKQLLPFLPEYSTRQPTEVLPFPVIPEK